MPTTLRHAAVLAACATLAACASSSEWEAGFGSAVRQARALQVIDPDAPSRAEAAPSADGKAVAGAQKAYAESYGYAVKEPKVTPLVLNPAGGGGKQ